jgi:lipid-A-disaccharide synthase
MARHLDGLAAIFPFEPAGYADTSLRVDFVGHPFLAPDYAAPVAFDPAGPVLLLPGSRRQVVTRIFPVLLEAFRLAAPGRPAVALYPSEEIRAVLLQARPPAPVSLQRTGSAGGPVAASAVLTASGTMSLQCALAGIPGAVTYRTDALTYLLGRLIVKVKYIGIANLLLGEAMYPEFIQGAATPAALAAQLRECAADPARLARTQAQLARLRTLLAQPASGTAADWLARHL